VFLDVLSLDVLWLDGSAAARLRGSRRWPASGCAVAEVETLPTAAPLAERLNDRAVRRIERRC
jgi:hypothetical protein